MTMILSSEATAQGMAGQSWIGGIAAALKRWCAAYITWRIEQAAIAHLQSMSGRELKDIGLTRRDFSLSGTRATAHERSFGPKLF